MARIEALTTQLILSQVASAECPIWQNYEAMGLMAQLATSTAAHWNMEKYARCGYTLGAKKMRVLKRKSFARWQATEKLPDAVLCQVIKEMESGLIDADLGGLLYKTRVARTGGGKSGGHRTLLSAWVGRRYVFLHGFSKSDKANITQNERKVLQYAGKVFLELSADALVKALATGVLLEIHCEQDH